MHLTQAPRRSETSQKDRGAVAVFFAVSAIVILGFMALAVDGAHAFVQHRESQSAADVSAIAGSFKLLDHSGTDAQKEADLVAEVKRIAAENLGPDLDWDGCTDPSRPAAYSNVASDTDCISWTYKWRQVRVRIPDREIPTFFGTAIGVDTITANAAAEVGVIFDGGAVLPLGLLSGSTDGIQCGKTASQAIPECERNASGNFQFLDFSAFGSLSRSTPEECSGQTTKRVQDNLAAGIDHLLELAPNNPTDHSSILATDSIFKDLPECNGFKRDAMAVVTQTGNQASSLTEGLITSSEPLARLRRGALTQSFNFNGTVVDDTPIWSWMLPSVISDCEAANALDPDPAVSDDPDIDTELEAVRCIDANSGVEIFVPEFGESPRLAMVPELHQSSWPSGGKYVSFKAFQFVYIQGVFGNCNAQKGTCDTVFIPGEPALTTIKKGNANITALTVIGLPSVTIPQTIRDAFLDPVYDSYVLIR